MAAIAQEANSERSTTASIETAVLKGCGFDDGSKL
jgi:hypothetical protein